VTAPTVFLLWLILIAIAVAVLMSQIADRFAGLLP